MQKQAAHAWIGKDKAVVVWVLRFIYLSILGILVVVSDPLIFLSECSAKHDILVKLYVQIVCLKSAIHVLCCIQFAGNNQNLELKTI